MLDYLKKTAEVFELINNRYQQIENTSLEIEKYCFIDFDFGKMLN